MKIVYSPLADQSKKTLLWKYVGIKTYFDELEKRILQAPFDAAEEKDIIEGKQIAVYKRKVKTGLFSGNYFASFLYLSLLYVVNETKQQIVVIGVHVRYYAD
jgi:hypothetical protein